jgi:hypothetical protein
MGLIEKQKKVKSGYLAKKANIIEPKLDIMEFVILAGMIYLSSIVCGLDLMVCFLAGQLKAVQMPRW